MKVSNFFTARLDRDFSDRINYFYTSAIFVVGGILLGGQQFFGQPIQCIIEDRKKLDKAWLPYIQNYCWTEPYFNKSVGDEIISRNFALSHSVPLIFLLQAFCFYLPSLCWRALLNFYTGIDIDGLTRSARDSTFVDSAARSECAHSVASQLECALRISHEEDELRVRFSHEDAESGRCGKRRSSSPYRCYVTIIYVLSKILCLSNAAGQIYFLNYLLASTDYLHGFSMLRKIVAEKIAILLWFWTVFVFLITWISLCYWLLVGFLQPPRKNFFKKLLRFKEKDAADIEIKAFTANMGADGHLFLRLLLENAGNLATASVISALWRSFKKSTRVKHYHRAERALELEPSLTSSLKHTGVRKLRSPDTDAGTPDTDLIMAPPPFENVPLVPDRGKNARRKQ